MYASRSLHASSIGTRAADALYGLLGLTHAVVAAVLRPFVWVTGRLLARLPWSCKFGLLAAALSLAAMLLSGYGRQWLIGPAELTDAEMAVLWANGLPQSFDALLLLASYVGLFLAACTALAFVRRRVSLLCLKLGGAAFAVVWACLLIVLLRGPGLLHLADAESFDKGARNDLWLLAFGVWLPGALAGALFLASLLLRSAGEFYTGQPAPRARPTPDARFRSASYWSTFLHLAVLFLIPLLLREWGEAEDAYGVPKGSGNPVVQMVKIKRVKKKIKRKEFVLNWNSPIVMYRPDIDDSKFSEQLDDETLDQYATTSLRGALGKGGGTTGGWPHGMEGAKVRFIRLEYRGGDWDQDMGVNADYNFLIEFHKLTGFQIADRTEHIPISRLRRFREHRRPPFVFITGKGGVLVSRQEIKTLRWYCLEEGGMIVADNGGGAFNRSFRRAMLSCFPKLRWIDISNDDILFRQPFVFPNGAPRLWHHSGDRALGLKHSGRWIVFYHQGDLNDAWKTGHSGVSKREATLAYRLGVNIVNYAFNQYMQIHFGD